MNTFFFIAGVLCFLLGVVHSFLGEYLIFNKKRIGKRLVPTRSSESLKERHLRIIWATWHLASIFGCCIGAILLKISFDPSQVDAVTMDFIIPCIMYVMLFSSLLVLIGTKGKHPGWVVFLIIAILLLLGS